MNITDLFIIGGGINGTGIAADAAGRGLSVVLCEQGDLASGTSSKSTKLIHGGLRYLEYGEFRLVREALREREVLMQKAPHLIHPLRFVMPHNPRLKPAWLLRIGLFLYDHLSRRHQLPASESIVLSTHPAGKILKKDFSRAFAYSDCWVDDARLVIANAMAAREKGATILTRTKFVSAKREKNCWLVLLEDTQTHIQQTLHAKVLINAAGPWVDEVDNDRLQLATEHHAKLVKGSHIVVPKLYDDDFALILTHTDKRIIFVIPYLEDYSLIGTTDEAFSGNPLSAQISAEEVDYLCGAVNYYLKKQVSASDVKWRYAGVRPLQSSHTENLSAVTRDYAFELNTGSQQALLFSIFGGKLTTYRTLAEHALRYLAGYFPDMGPAWTEHAALPGGEIPDRDYPAFIKKFCAEYAWLPSTLADRYAKQYGARAYDLLQDTQEINDLGKLLGADLYEKELAYLMREEWAMTAEDVLWRRTKLGLRFTAAEVMALEEMMAPTPPSLH